ncbi:MAG: acylphosphatase [Chloroflexi bacterium]|nr:acylphosphatase [Chloroflexota bacterium]
MAEQLHAIVKGQVQGVSFRHYTQLRAGELGLSGWVKNLSDGTVEVLAEGERAALENLLRFLQRGPSGACVSGVDVQWREASGQYQGFTIRYGHG